MASHHNPPITPIILAAGPKGELSFPKAAADFEGRTALQIALDNCMGLGKAVVVLGSDAAQIKKIVPREICSVLNPRWDDGQISSIRAGLRKIPEGNALLLYPVDYPLLTAEVIARLVTAFEKRTPEQKIFVPRYRDRGGHPVLFVPELRGELMKAKTARDVTYRDQNRVLHVDVGTAAIWQDIDTPAAYRRRLREYRRSATVRGSSDVRRLSAPRKLDGGLRSYLAEVGDGASLSRETALRLLECGEDDLPFLLETARTLKERFKPKVITYSRKIFLPLTNLCRDYCGYCIFRRDPGQPGAHTMTPEEVLRIATEGERLGCREALFSLGDKPEAIFPEMRETLRYLGYKSTLDYLVAMCELVMRETQLIPHANPGLMSPQWLRRLREYSPSIGLMLESTSKALLAPGAAHDNAPDKIPALRLKVLEDAGRQNIPFTTGILIGIGETAADRVDSLMAIRDLHLRHGHIQEVIVQNFRVKAGIAMAGWAEPGRDMMLRTLAVARLILRDMNIQAPPNLSRPDYEDLLSAGINDWGGVSPLTPDFINPEAPWPHLEDLRRRTEAAGYKLKQRLPVYPEFLDNVARHRGPAAAAIKAAADEHGYAKLPTSFASKSEVEEIVVGCPR